LLRSFMVSSVQMWAWASIDSGLGIFFSLTIRGHSGARAQRANPEPRADAERVSLDSGFAPTAHPGMTAERLC
jgi:hypothetical protein